MKSEQSPLLDHRLRFASRHDRQTSGARTYGSNPFLRGIASEYISHLKPWKAGVDRQVGLYVRVSAPTQVTNGNLKQAIADACHRVQRRGYRVVRIFSEQAHSSIFFPRTELLRAISFVRDAGITLVAPSRDRLFRHEDWDRTNRTEWPAIYEYREFERMAAGVNVATIDDPDKQTRKQQIQRGKFAKGARDGRPRAETHGPGWRKRRKRCYAWWVRIFREEGFSLRRIARHFMRAPAGYPPPSHVTILNWSKCNSEV